MCRLFFYLWISDKDWLINGVKDWLINGVKENWQYNNIILYIRYELSGKVKVYEKLDCMKESVKSIKCVQQNCNVN